MRRLFVVVGFLIAVPSLATIAPFKLTNPSVILPPATKGTFYNVHIAPLVIPTGGVPPYSYTLNKKGPVPPAWLKLSPKGVVSGTPTATGTVNFAFTVYDSSASSSGQGSLTVGTVVASRVPDWGWDDFITGCSGSKCGILGTYTPPKPFEFAKDEPNPWWFLTLRGSGLRTMRSPNAD